MVKAAIKNIVSNLVITSVVLLGLLNVLSWHAFPTSFTPIRAASYQIKAEMGSCSATLIAPRTLLTAAHCLDMGPLKVNGLPATPIKKDEAKDLALLFVDIDCPCISVGKDVPDVGRKVWRVGYPLNVGQFVTEGRFQGINTLGGRTFQLTDALGMFGNSGGGVFVYANGKFTLVGVTSAVAIAQIYGMPSPVAHLTLDVPLEDILNFIGTLK